MELLVVVILSGVIDMVLFFFLKECVENKVYFLYVILFSYLVYFNSERICCGVELVCDSIVVLVCCRICVWVRFVVFCV